MILWSAAELRAFNGSTVRSVGELIDFIPDHKESAWLTRRRWSCYSSATSFRFKIVILKKVSQCSFCPTQLNTTHRGCRQIINNQSPHPFHWHTHTHTHCYRTRFSKLKRLRFFHRRTEPHRADFYFERVEMNTWMQTDEYWLLKRMDRYWRVSTCY